MRALLRAFRRREVARPPRQLVGAGVLFLNARGEVLLVRRGDNGRWDVPGGRVEPGEATDAAARRELAAGEKAQGQGAPDAVDHVHRHGADGIVNAEVFQQVHAEDHDDAGDAADHDRSERAHPVAGGGDGHQARQEAVGDGARIPDLAAEVD